MEKLICLIMCSITSLAFYLKVVVLGQAKPPCLQPNMPYGWRRRAANVFIIGQLAELARWQKALVNLMARRTVRINA